jgi:hypothetical protein
MTIEFQLDAILTALRSGGSRWMQAAERVLYRDKPDRTLTTRRSPEPT